MSPVVYLFHGEDEFSIAQAVQGLEARLGDPASAVMNTARLDGRAISLDVLRNAASAIPFIGERRLVIVDSPLAKIDPVPASHEKFLALLDGLPDSTALILVEHKPLVVEKKKGGKVAVIKHWLLLWAESGGERVYVRAYPAPDSNKMAEFIQAQAKAAGGGSPGARLFSWLDWWVRIRAWRIKRCRSCWRTPTTSARWRWRTCKP